MVGVSHPRPVADLVHPELATRASLDSVLERGVEVFAYLRPVAHYGLAERPFNDLRAVRRQPVPLLLSGVAEDDFIDGHRLRKAARGGYRRQQSYKYSSLHNQAVLFHRPHGVEKVKIGVPVRREHIVSAGADVVADVRFGAVEPVDRKSGDKALILSFRVGEAVVHGA